MSPKLTIYKHVSDKSKKCLTVVNSGILSVICRRLKVSSLLLAPAHLEAWNFYNKYDILF